MILIHNSSTEKSGDCTTVTTTAKAITTPETTTMSTTIATRTTTTATPTTSETRTNKPSTRIIPSPTVQRVSKYVTLTVFFYI